MNIAEYKSSQLISPYFLNGECENIKPRTSSQEHQESRANDRYQ
jgi:hypothetical protein